MNLAAVSNVEAQLLAKIQAVVSLTSLRRKHKKP